MTEDQTVIALRITAFISSVSFAFAYARSIRAFWLSFFAWHVVHLGFIFWYLLGLHHQQSTFNFWSGLTAYLLIVAMGCTDLFRPNSALRFTLGLHFIWLNLCATFVMMIVKHWSEGFRVHSLLGIAILLTSAWVRFRDGPRSLAIPPG